MKTWTQLTLAEQREARDWWETAEEVASKMTPEQLYATLFGPEKPEASPWPSPPVDFRALPSVQWREYACSAVLLPVGVSQRIDRMLEHSEPFTDEICDELEAVTSRFSGIPVEHLRWDDHAFIYDPETR